MTPVEARVQEIRKRNDEGKHWGMYAKECIAFLLDQLATAERDREAAKELLRQMVADEAFADLCAGIGEEPKWLKGARALLAAQEVK